MNRRQTSLVGKPGRGTHQPASLCSQASMVCVHGVSSDAFRKSRYRWREENKYYVLKADEECTGEEAKIAREV